MNDYGKAQAHLVRAGLGWDHPGKQPKKPARVPEKWTDNEWEWEACMRELGFESCDDNRWCATVTPTPTSFGWCVIVALETRDPEITQGHPMFTLHLTIDTVENEQDSPWVYPDAMFETPLEAARAGLAMVSGLVGIR